MVKEEKEMMKVSAKVPDQSVGWLETELPKSVMKRLQSYIETAKKNPTSMNSSLAGNISNSLSLKDEDNWFFETILLPLISRLRNAILHMCRI